MPESEAPEFNLQRPLSSALAVLRAILFSPRRFYLGFSPEGPLREPAIFVLLVGAVTAVLTAAVAMVSNLIFGELSAGEVGVTALEAVLFALLSPVAVGAVAAALTAAVAIVSNLIFGELSAGEVGVTALEAVLFALLSPLAVGVVAAVYLLSIRTFVGNVGTFREVYRAAAYAFGALILAWIPIVGAFAVTYALMVLMGIAVRIVYRTSFLTAVVTVLVGFLPISLALIFLRVTTAGLAS